VPSIKLMSQIPKQQNTRSIQPSTPGIQ